MIETTISANTPTGRALRKVVQAVEHARALYDETHDLKHKEQALIDAGIAYALYGDPEVSFEGWWPFEPEKFKPRSREENIARAASFFVSALARLELDGD